MADEPPTDLTMEALCPYIPDPTVVETLLKDEYGLTVTSLESLIGYYDKNYKAVVAKDAEVKGHNSCDPEVRELFVKVLNSKDSKTPEFIHSQMLLMDHLNKHGIDCQEEIEKLDGEYFSRLTVDKSGVKESCVVSVRTFLPGQVLAKHTLTPPLLYELGLYLAKIHTALKDFYADYYETFDCTWSLDKVPDIRKLVHVVKENYKREIVKDILKSFDENVLPMKEKFRKAQIHGDPNEHNILLIPDDNSLSGYTISGLLDYQDSARTHPIYDLAILCCYTMMMTESQVPLLDVAGYILKGYLSLLDLSPEERSCLQTLIASRMAMSLVYGAFTFMQNPENDYVILSSLNGWELMEKFWMTSRDDVDERWKGIIETYEYKTIEP